MGRKKPASATLLICHVRSTLDWFSFSTRECLTLTDSYLILSCNYYMFFPFSQSFHYYYYYYGYSFMFGIHIYKLMEANLSGAEVGRHVVLFASQMSLSITKIWSASDEV